MVWNDVYNEGVLGVLFRERYVPNDYYGRLFSFWIWLQQDRAKVLNAWATVEILMDALKKGASSIVLAIFFCIWKTSLCQQASNS